jgi:hypothetical protein
MVDVTEERIYESMSITTTSTSSRACRTLDECIVTLIRLTAEVQGLRCGIHDRYRIYSQGKKENVKAYHSRRFLLSLSVQLQNFKANKRLAKNESSGNFFGTLGWQDIPARDILYGFYSLLPSSWLVFGQTKKVVWESVTRTFSPVPFMEREDACRSPFGSRFIETQMQATCNLSRFVVDDGLTTSLTRRSIRSFRSFLRLPHLVML